MSVTSLRHVAVAEPRRVLPNVFPILPLFVRLLGFAHRFNPTQSAVKDLVNKTSASHTRLLNDVLTLRSLIYQSLDADLRTVLDDDGEVFFLLLAGPGYDYVVGFLAIVALGGVVVPVSPHAPLSEALYFAEKSTASALVFDRSSKDVARSVQEQRDGAARSSSLFPAIEIGKGRGATALVPEQICIHPSRSLNLRGPGLVIFTSGTTSRPKAVVLPREILCSGSLVLADHFELTPQDVTLHCMPVHHIAGIAVCLVPFLLSGACLEFDRFNVQRVWDRFRQGGLTVFAGVPTMYSRLMRHYEDHISTLPDRDDYIRGLGALRFMMSGTSALHPELRTKWTKLSGGKRILERYGSSELSTVILTPLHNSLAVPDGSVGKTLSGCDVRLKSEPEGEILVKAPGMISRYHNDPPATKAAFDENGYYKTGDIGRREGQYWFIMGRASSDIIKTGGYKISALDIEREITALPYVSEASVVGVPDEEFGQRVAAMVVLRDLRQSLSINHLRDDLRIKMSGYKLPTLLYVAPAELPKTASGKTQKVALGKEVFESGRHDAQVQRYSSKSSLPATRARL